MAGTTLRTVLHRKVGCFARWVDMVIMAKVLTARGFSTQLANSDVPLVDFHIARTTLGSRNQPVRGMVPFAVLLGMKLVDYRNQLVSLVKRKISWFWNCCSLVLCVELWPCQLNQTTEFARLE